MFLEKAENYFWITHAGTQFRLVVPFRFRDCDGRNWVIASNDQTLTFKCRYCTLRKDGVFSDIARFDQDVLGTVLLSTESSLIFNYGGGKSRAYVFSD